MADLLATAFVVRMRLRPTGCPSQKNPGTPCQDAMHHLSSWISSDSKDNQRVARPKRGRIRGTSAAKPKPQATESTSCDFAAVVGRATNSLRYGIHPLQWEGLEHGCPATAGPSVPLPLHRVISSSWTLQPGPIHCNLSSRPTATPKLLSRQKRPPQD